MGWLHDGHRSLMQRARRDNATTVVTIFVNPRQFNEAADYQRYPRNEARDLAICEAEGVDLVWRRRSTRSTRRASTPSSRSGALARPLEGAARPGHFDGVATVVAILFDVVGAERAYFGQKDAQQVMVIRRMARDLAIPTEVVACPTVREPDGLALSSRNVHLSPEERAAAPVLHRALLAAATRLGGRRALRRRAAGRRCGASWRGAARRRRLRLGRRRATLDELERVDGPGAALARGPLRRRPASSTTSRSDD